MLGKYKERRRSESDVGREGDAAADRQPTQKTTKGGGDGKWAKQQQKKTKGASGTTKMKPEWQAGRPWLDTQAHACVSS